MKIIIIIAIIVGVVSAGILGYVLYKQNMCTQMPGYWHSPRPASIWECLEYDNRKNTSETVYQIPAHSYEIWNSYGIVIHGMVGKSVDYSPVAIQIHDKQGNLIGTSQVIPDSSGRFVHGIAKQDSQAWENITSYDITATYANPFPEDNRTLKHIQLDKDTIPLDSEQIKQLSHDQIIQTIRE